MKAEVVLIESTRKNDALPLTIALENRIPGMFKVLYEEKDNKRAVFITSGCFTGSKVTLLRIGLGPKEQLYQQQATITMTQPEKEVKANVICTYSEKEDSIYLDCFY